MGISTFFNLLIIPSNLLLYINDLISYFKILNLNVKA